MCCNHRCLYSVYSNTLLIMYLSAIGKLVCRREISLIGCTSFGFAQNTIHDFQNTVLNSLSSGIVFDKCQTGNTFIRLVTAPDTKCTRYTYTTVASS